MIKKSCVNILEYIGGIKIRKFNKWLILVQKCEEREIDILVDSRRAVLQTRLKRLRNFYLFVGTLCFASCRTEIAFTFCRTAEKIHLAKKDKGKGARIGYLSTDVARSLSLPPSSDFRFSAHCAIKEKKIFSGEIDQADKEIPLEWIAATVQVHRRPQLKPQKKLR